MSTSVTRAWGLAAALLISLLLAAPTAFAAAPDPVAACDGTAYTATTVAGRAAVSCDDGWVRDWQRLRIADAEVVRGSSGDATLSFVVTRPEAGNPIAVDYATADGTARAGTDYTAGSGQLVLEADETSKTIDVPVTSLARAGDDLRLSVALSDPSGVALFARDRASGWILNRFFRPEAQPDAEYICDGGFYSLPARPEGGVAVVCLGRVIAPIVSAPVVDPRAGVATFTITRPPEADGEGSDYGSYFIAYSTADGTARAGVDYTAVSGRVILPSFKHSIAVSVPVDPSGSGAGRTFSLELTTDRPGTTIGVYDAVRRATVPVTGTATLRSLGEAVDGTPRVGRALTAAAGADSYAWWRCDPAGACQPILAATGQSYTPTALDQGFTLRVRATAALAAGSTQIGEAAAAGPVRAAALATPTFADGPAAGAVVRSPAADFAFSGKEADAAYECSLDGAAYAACDTTLSFTTLASGPHTLSVRQKTVDGIASAAVTRAWTVAAAPDGAAACDGTAFTTSVVSGRDVVACDDGGIRDWQRVAIADARVARGTSGGATLRFVVTRPEAGSPLFLRARTIAGSAAAGSDFSPLDTTVVLEADQTQTTVSVPVTSSVSAVDDRTVQLALSDEQGAGIEFTRARATGVIGNSNETANRVDADYACDGGLYDIVIVDRLPNPRCLNTVAAPFQTVVASSPTVDPAAGVAVFELVRRAGGGRAWFAWETVDGSARAGVDYVASSGTVRMAESQVSRRVVVPLLDAAGADGDRDFTLHLTSGHASQSGFSGTDGTATIRRFTPALAGLPRVGRATAAAAPGAAGRQWQRCDVLGACWPIAGASGASYTPRADDLGRRLRVRATVAGEAGMTIAAVTPVTQPVRVDVVAPMVDGGPSGVVIARDATFALSGKEADAQGYECAVDGGGFAACGASGELSFTNLASGPHSVRVRWRTVEDLLSAATTRSWTVAAAPDGAAACDGTAFTTSVVSGRDVVACDDGGIRDWQRVSIADASVVRGTDGAVLRFAVSRPAAGSPLFLRVRTAAGTAVAGSDFTMRDDVLVLESDQTSATVEVPVTGRATAGDDLTLRVALSDEQGGVVEFARAAATGTIRNTETTTIPDAETACDGGGYDLPVIDGWRTVRCLGGSVAHLSVAARAVAVDPRAGVALFELRRETYGGPVGIAYATVDGSARAGADYVATSGSLVMSGQQTVARVAVPLLDPAGADGDRDFGLHLSAASPIQAGTTVTDGTATIRRFTPALAGLPRVGQPLGGAAPGADTRQWQRCDALGACWPIASATGAAYTPTAEDLGRRLRVRATAAGEAGETLTAETPATAAARDVVATPTLTGGPAEGSTDNARSVSFTLSGKEGDASWECSVDGDPFGACGEDGGGVVTLSGLTGGPRSFAVRQRTVDDLVSPAPTRSWTIPGGPDPAAACDGTSFTRSKLAGRWFVACDDGGTRDWQRVRIEDARVARGTSGGATLSFAITRPEAGSPLVLRARTVGGTAVAGSDFTPLDALVVLEADETATTVTVPVTSATDAADDVTVAVALADERDAGIEFARARATGTIANSWTSGAADGDAACEGGSSDLIVVDGAQNPRCLDAATWPFQTVAASSPTVDPAAGVAVFELERRAGGGRAWFAWETVDGSARAGVDFVPSSGTVTMAGQQTRARVVVPLLDPADIDGDRSFTLHLTSGDASMTGFAGTDGTATIRRFTPALAGIARVGQPLSGGLPAGAARQWQRCDALGACWNLPGAIAADYTPTAADLGRGLRVRAAVAGDAGETIAAATPLTALVRDVVATPTLSGGPAEGAATEATEATFTLAGKEDDADWECALDGTAFAACDAHGGTVALSGLAPGAHTFAARQRTIDDLASPAATRAWTITAPEPRTPGRGDGETPGRGGGTPGGDTTPGGTTPGGSGGGTNPGGRSAPRLRVAGVRQQNRTVTRAAAGITNIVLHCSRRCALSVPLTISARDARRLGLRSTRIGVARGSAAEAGLVRLRVRLAADAKPRLLQTATLLRVVVLVPNPAGRAVRVSFGLKPAARPAVR